MSRFTDRIDRESRRVGNQDTYQEIGVTCTIRTTATVYTDSVYVTLDSDPIPQPKILVEWRPEVSSSGVLARVYPQRGRKGTVIFRDRERPWLLW